MICCASPDRRPSTRIGIRLVVGLLVLGLVASSPLLAKKSKKNGRDMPSPEELFNPHLGIDYSHWLMGPVVHMATTDEVQSYLSVQSDAEAKAFIEAFWTQRAEGTPIFTDTPQKIYAGRVVEANKRFSEAAFPGSRTVRGRIFVLYGEPESIVFEQPIEVGDPTPELWTYGEGTKAGLDGQQPQRHYRFLKDGDSTVLMTESLRRQMRARDRLRRGRN